MAILLLTAGCSTGTPDTTENTPSRTSPVEAPEDRDESAVLAALRRLDLCAVLIAADGPATPPTRPVAREPFTCGIAGGSVSIVRKDTEARLRMPMRTIAGARAYVEFTASDTCDVDFPVSFDLVLEFRITRQGAGPEGCGPDVEEFVSAAVAAVGDQPASEPRWDACSALEHALNDPGTLLPAGPSVGGTCERWEPSLAHLDLGYANPIIGEARTETVGGVAVSVQVDDSTGTNVCWMSWRSGQADSPYAASPDQWVGVAAPDCPATTRLAESVMAVLATPPPSTTPQQPLLYGPDEADSPFPGACAHLDPKVAKHCVPFTEPPLPEGKTAVLNVAKTDDRVHCAIARTAITAHFGERLIPVTVNDGGQGTCYFVEPERQVQLRFQLGTSQLTGVADVFTVREADTAGHPTYIADAPGQRAYEVWVAMSDSPDDDGYLMLAVDGGPASRGAGPPADTRTTVDQVVTDVLNEYFS